MSPWGQRKHRHDARNAYPPRHRACRTRLPRMPHGSRSSISANPPARHPPPQSRARVAIHDASNAAAAPQHSSAQHSSASNSLASNSLAQQLPCPLLALVDSQSVFAADALHNPPRLSMLETLPIEPSRDFKSSNGGTQELPARPSALAIESLSTVMARSKHAK